MPIRGVPYRLSVLLLSLLPTLASSQWVPANGLAALARSSVKCFTTDNTSLYAGSWGAGIFLSTDNGGSWNAASQGLANLNVYSTAFTGASLLAGTLGGGLFRSTDGALSWKASDSGLTNLNVLALLANGTSILAGTAGGVFRSTDDGVSWSGAGTGLTGTNVHALAKSSANLFAGTRGGGVFRSADGGDTWTPASTGLTNLMVETFCVSGTNLLAGTWGGGVFRSTDDGDHWTKADTGLTVLKVWLLAASGSAILAGTDQGVFRTTNAGDTWTESDAGIPIVNYGSYSAPTPVIGLMPLGSEVLAGTSNYGIYRSTDEGLSWSMAVPYFDGRLVNSVAGSGHTVLAAIGQDTPDPSDGVYRSTDEGATWKRVLVNPDKYPIDVVTFSGSRAFAGTVNGIYRSDNDGVNWGNLIPVCADQIVTAIAVRRQTIIAGTWQGCYSSTDDGASWSIEPGGGLWVNALAWHDSTIFAVGDSFIVSRICRSTNDGKDWEVVLSGGADYSAGIYSIASCGPTLLAGDVNFPTGYIYRSTDHGLSWPQISTLPPHPWYLLTKEATVFAGTNSGVYRSTDTGTTWTSVNRGFTGRITSLADGDPLLFASTNNGIFRRPYSEIMTSVREDRLPLPMSFTLYQNFPNPFNPETRISFSLQEESDVTLEIFDLLGRHVTTLLHERKPAGVHQVRWEGRDSPSGVYFCRMDASPLARSSRSYIQVRKMLLLR